MNKSLVSHIAQCNADDLDAVTNSNEKQYLNFEIKQVTKKGEFTGLAAAFGNIDQQKEIIMPGAFEESIAKFQDDPTSIAILSQHDQRMPVGKLTEIKEITEGLFVRGQMALEIEEAEKTRKLVVAKLINHLSIGFKVIDSEFDKDTGVLIIKKVDLLEFSFVTIPANRSAKILSMKNNEQDQVVSKKEITDLDNIETLRDAEAYLRHEGLSKNKATAIVSIIKRQLLSESEVPPKTNPNLSESDKTKNNQEEYARLFVEGMDKIIFNLKNKGYENDNRKTS